MISNSSFF